MHPKGLALLALCMYSTVRLLTAARKTVNVATISGRTCSQSSTHDEQGPSCNAANGDTSGDYSVSNCIHTDASDTEQWFEVDLGGQFHVSSVKVWGRSRYLDRLYPFDIHVDGQYCGKSTDTGDRKHTVTCSNPVWGHKVRLTRTSKDGFLNLCEMEVPFIVSECSPPFHYGQDCNTPCSANCGGEPGSMFCEKKDGKCYGCVAGYHGDQCRRTCAQRTRNCTECTQQDGQCTSCSSGLQPPRCTDCIGNFQPPECKGCKYGYHGVKCDQPCSSIGTNNFCRECSQNGDCTACQYNFESPGCTDCEDGYYKQSDSNCEPCSDNCVERKCDRDSGRCNAGCPEGRWGNTCEKYCNRNCVSATCGRDDGHCDGCQRGYHGDKCDQQCSSIGTNRRCVGCSQIGVCTRCISNFKAPGCTDCEDGYYKQSDSQCRPCSATCVDRKCDRDSGRCNAGCPEGRWGNTCEKYCNPNCVSATCGRDDGHCDGCKYGYHGNSCDQRCSSIGTNRRCVGCSQIGVCTRCRDDFKPPGCTDCEDGYYKDSNSNCRRCSDTCVDKKCDRLSGRCNGCPEGRWGETCESDCHYCVSATCGRDDGHCGDCQSGWWGDRCYDACTDNQHHCATNTCERVQGKCYGCDSGYHGDRCDQTCKTKSILDICATCSQAGVCTGCAGNTVYPGCSECLDGYYRERSSSNSCSRCTWQCGGDAPCDKATGDCDQCPVGKEGKRCQQECPPGFYGKGCTSTCGSCQLNTTCHHESGKCPQGCAEGYGGTLCMQAAATEEHEGADTVVPLLGALLGVAVIVIIVIIILFIAKRHRSTGEAGVKVDAEPAQGVDSLQMAAVSVAVGRSPPQPGPQGEGHYEIVVEEHHYEIVKEEEPKEEVAKDEETNDEVASEEEDYDDVVVGEQHHGEVVKDEKETPYENVTQQNNVYDPLQASCDQGATYSRPTFRDKPDVTLYANQVSSGKKGAAIYRNN